MVRCEGLVAVSTCVRLLLADPALSCCFEHIAQDQSCVCASLQPVQILLPGCKSALPRALNTFKAKA